jgi:hypothetical protein
VAVTPDGQHAVVGGAVDALAVLDLGDLMPNAGADPDFLCLKAELLSGQRFHERGGTVNLSADEWLVRWRAYRQQSPNDTGTWSREMIRPQPSAASAPLAASRSLDVGIGTPEEVEIPPEDFSGRFSEAADWLGAGRVVEASATGRAFLPVLRRNVEQSPDDPNARYELALGLLLAGDLEGYRRACAATLEQLGRSEDPLIGEAARACLIGPDAVDDPSSPQRLAVTAVSREPNLPWWHYVLGLAEFRARRCERAVEHATKSIDLGARWPAAPLNYPVLAMAHHVLGHRAEARRWLERAHGLGSADVLRSKAAWWDRVEFLLLLREADATILDVTFPADPFAP